MRFLGYRYTQWQNEGVSFETKEPRFELTKVELKYIMSVARFGTTQEKESVYSLLDTLESGATGRTSE